jgi:hypothetical protein
MKTDGEKIMDKILRSLQGKAFHLSDETYDFLAGKYSELTLVPIPDVEAGGFHKGVIRQIINYHREQFLTDKYIQSRITNPTTGTIDHLHAEIIASIAVRLGQYSGYNGYALELLRTAAHFHDSDRSFPDKMVGGEEKVRGNPAGYREYKRLHALNSAERAREMAQRANDNGFHSPSGFVNDLTYLIIRHELGGEKNNGINVLMKSEVEPDLNLNDLTNVVTDSDSLAYFYANILTNWEECGKNENLLGNKVHYMYVRMTKKAQEDLRKTIIFSDNHILGSDSYDNDINSIRKILLLKCT